ncbi:MAG: DNA-directed RNA polymerase subunit beta' [Candidatus Berkelbacteria bacterium Licking1014_85]|uniref:DNA-directed RNA polymerase subunit beta' n=1 Tax=Candidatus Berkelbacteria bacterium Licking1014_85 TaxID=2017148 RepID=A0A554LMH0_9BACT|nr:MAG: DNA-directed RNA polymerase subunit beta' [Candidatus Berkelbacteria bacterium Licking1014_85]
MEKTENTDNFNKLRLSIASPDNIEHWSYGEITKPETINYRTQKPERDGLFDERIFGPTKDYECYCGKYKKIRYKGVICDKCGVEVTHSSVRRERMGHINLAVPVGHVWYLRGVPSLTSVVLRIPMSDIEKVIYFASFIVLEINDSIKTGLLDQLNDEYHQLKSSKVRDNVVAIDAEFKKTKNEIESLGVGQLISEQTYFHISEKYGNLIRVGIGSEAIYEMLKSINLDEEINRIENMLSHRKEKTIDIQFKKDMRRLKSMRLMKKAGIHPSWMILTKLPVIPPDLRPMVQLDGGRFAASDLNDLYRRIINRNNRLKKLIASGAPEVITRNERRMLQEAVDALIDNNARRDKSPQTTGTGRKLRSLSDMLRGKQGRFRQNLLGKRVDYSGRSVIVVGPQLNLDQCGLPKIIALELFKPFIISKLISEGFVHNVKNASKMIEHTTPEVWDILERITQDAYVLLNRAPTLHRLGIQAFKPVLIEGKAIQIHPLVCAAFNADFDGDQMAVHLPLSTQAVIEAKNIVLSTANLLKPASGEPIVNAEYDIVFGCYFLTTTAENCLGENKIFNSKNEAITAFHSEAIDLRAKIKVRIVSEGIIETSVGRILFNNILPDNYPYINEEMNKKKLKALVSTIYRVYGKNETSRFVDNLKNLGFEYSTLSGLSIAIEDVVIPDEKPALIKIGENKVNEIEEQYNLGLITEDEKKLKIIELWQDIREQIEKKMVSAYSPDNNILQTVSSGARGSLAQVIQMGGMKGLVVNPSGEIITHPVKASFKEGLDVYEYFISSHAARKGKSDTSLRTSDAGYLTRRLVDVSQDIVVSINDCGSKEGIEIYNLKDIDFVQSFDKRILGRVALSNIKVNGKTIVKANEIIGEDATKLIFAADLDKILVRSPIHCQSKWGICQKCYGRDLATGNEVNIGEAVGIMAAQAIGEPGTQLTMQTFHVGGVHGQDVTTGLPRVEELFEARPPKNPAIIAEISGKVKIAESKDLTVISISSGLNKIEEYDIPEDYQIMVKDKDNIKSKQAIATHNDEKAIRSELSGIVEIKGRKVTVTSKDIEIKEYAVNPSSTILVENNDMVMVGQILTDDYLNLSEAISLIGVNAVQQYIITEIQKIYQAQGQDIHDKHIEIILRQMFSKRIVKNSGSSEELIGQIIDISDQNKINEKLTAEGKTPIDSDAIILGVSRVAIKTKSFLSAASFQETTNVLIEAASSGQIDELRGLKENVIIGRLIPAGTGFKHANN